MPSRKRKVKNNDDDDGDEDYNPEGDESPDDEPFEKVEEEEEQQQQHQHQGEVDNDNSNDSKIAAKPKREKKLRRKINYEPPEIDLLPTHERKTKAGGYAHTNKSKERISMANRGNTPWNKGKQRSSADKAKIKAGVQARNRAIKLEKLKVHSIDQDCVFMLLLLFSHNPNSTNCILLN